MLSRSALLAPAIGAMLATACAGNSAPAGFLPMPVAAQTTAFGGWIELELVADSAAKGQRGERVEGELLAVTPDSVWVLTDEGGRAIATASVREGQLTGYRAQVGSITGWTALGVVSTISNGVGLIITAPLWVLTGTIAGSGESRAPVSRVPTSSWTDLARFARFPQGLPAGVAIQSLQPKVARQ